ncbi:MAG: serine hydrolase [Flavobacteriaceae bacterium]|nr:serine hydrolase [Flavobacteriaceae bacterium]
MRKISTLLLFFLAINTLTAQQPDPLLKLDSYGQDTWVDSIIKNMSLDQKIGQLLMIDTYSNRDAKHMADIDWMIQKYEVGGIIFFQGTPAKQLELTNHYQQQSKIPLLVGFDGEWGLSMRLQNTFRYPYNMTLGAIQDNSLIEKLGERIGTECKRIGIDVNFAPVLDVNINPKNPIIGNRSFGEDPENVAQKGIAFTKGLQSRNVLACGKHFPGHGDTDTDSHLALPTIPFDRQRLDSVEMYPYPKLFDAGLASVMVAHLSVPALEPNAGLPSSLSKNIITNILKDSLGFEGLIMTDALNMKGAADFSSASDINLQALIAGNDLLLMPAEIPQTITKIKEALKSGVLSEDQLEASVRKILKAKYWAGLRQYKPLPAEHLNSELNALDDAILNQQLLENAMTLIRNEGDLFPVRDLVANKIAYVAMGDDDNSGFVQRLNDYAQVDVVAGKKLDELMKKLEPYNLVIIGFHKSDATPWKNYKFTDRELVWLQEIAREKKVILDVFASPYSLLDVKTFANIDGILVSYQNNSTAQDVSAQMIFGALTTKGKLPVSIGTTFPVGTGLKSTDLRRLSYGYPEQAGMSSALLSKVDVLAQHVLDSAMAPGLQILVAKEGKVVYRKSFGYHTGKKVHRVQNGDLYDLASVTKILGALPLIMKAEEEGKYTIDTRLGELFPILQGTDKDTIVLKDALSHYAQLIPWIPFYRYTIDSTKMTPSGQYYRNRYSKKFDTQVAKNIYLRSDYRDTIYQMIADSPLLPKRKYVYSGLIFYLFNDYFQKTYNQTMDKLDYDNFYHPLGAKGLTYKPLDKFNVNVIVPTEDDKDYRHQLLQGYVHDQGAAMLGGVNGNAGLFGDSNDVAKMMQMYMQGGYYGGKRYFKTETIDKFNHRYYAKEDVRRGLGFDKPQIDPKEKASCGCVSSESFGHSGFTGTYVWADPKTRLVYVFLSNRVNPRADNNKLIESNMRTRVQQLIQDAIVK